MQAVNKRTSLALHRTPLGCSVALVLTASSAMAADTIASGPALTAGSRPLYASAAALYPFAQRA
jgi:zinc transporter ZupT